jgi:transcription initiation factor TFIIH subunit 4
MKASSTKKEEQEQEAETETTTDLFSFLETLPRTSLLALYEDPTQGQFAAKTTLQKLPELARQITIRLSVCGGAFPYDKCADWSSSQNKRDVKLALSRMEALCVINPVPVLLANDADDTTAQDVETELLLGNMNSNKQQKEKRKKQKSKAGKKFILDNIDPKGIIQLSPPFQKAIKVALTSITPAPYPELSNEELERFINLETNNGNGNSINNYNGNMAEEKEKKYPNQAPTPTQLETFTQKRWDSVLHYLVGTDDSNYEDPPEAIQHFLQETGLMQEDPDYRGKHVAPLIISSKGYEFMLQDVIVQVWQFILKYIKKMAGAQVKVNTAVDQQEAARKEALLFLICLSYCKVGKGYPAGALTKRTKKIMKEWSYFGLLYICKIGGALIFFPTRVAVNLVVGGLTDGIGSAAGSASESTSLAALSSSAAATRVLENALEAPIPSKNHIAIIVQTNFQVCAYTTSSLHVSMLGLFCDVTTFRRLPNVIFYRITRDSVKGAFKLGIEARQILRFLKMHAHPRLRTGDQPLIPGNVEDQIILWDRERSRVRMNEVYSLQCQNGKEFDAVRQYAQDHDAFGWGSELKLRIMVNYDKGEQIYAFVRRWRSAQMKKREARDTGM